MIAVLLEKDIEDKTKSELLTVSLLISRVKKMEQLPLETETLWSKSELRSKICQTIVNIGYFKKKNLTNSQTSFSFRIKPLKREREYLYRLGGGLQELIIKFISYLMYQPKSHSYRNSYLYKKK